VEDGEDRVEALRKDLKEKIIDYIQEQIKTGLDKDLLLEVCPDENIHYIRSIFNEEQEIAGDEQGNENKPKKKPLLRRTRS
jgi:hypothetical protein